MRDNMPSVARWVLLLLVGCLGTVARGQDPCEIVAGDPITVPWTKCHRFSDQCWGDAEDLTLCLPISVWHLRSPDEQDHYWTWPQGDAPCAHVRNEEECEVVDMESHRAKAVSLDPWFRCGAGGPTDSCSIGGVLCAVVDLWEAGQTSCDNENEELLPFFEGAQIWACGCEEEALASGGGLMAASEPSW